MGARPVVCTVLFYVVASLVDVLVVEFIIRSTSAWNVIGYWHSALTLLLVTTPALISLATSSTKPLILGILYYITCVEDLMYALWCSLLRLWTWDWVDPFFSWYWLDKSPFVRLIATVLGLPHVTTLCLYISCGVATVLTLLIARIREVSVVGSCAKVRYL